MAVTLDMKKQMVSTFGSSANDTGSTQVQIALLTQRISSVTEHLKANKHDYSSKRGLLKMVAKRRCLVRYLEQTNPEVYSQVIVKLGLKK